MRTAELWASLVLAHMSTYLLAACQYTGPFTGQRPSQQQQLQQLQREVAYSGKRGSAAANGGTSNTLSEPTCEELRAMWRYSKRQSRAAESSNELPVYRDPFAYNVWEAYPSRAPATVYRDDYTGPARSRSGGAPIYGKLVHKAPASSRLRNGMPSRTRAFEEVAQLYGTINRNAASPRRRLTSFRVGGGGGGGGSAANEAVPQQGSFQHLKELILNERARELQEQRRAEEMAARAAVLKEMSSGESHDGRSANYIIPYQGALDYKNAEFSRSAYEADKAIARGDYGGREYMIR